MSRKRFFVVYFFVALAISVLWELATPGIADIRPAAIAGGVAGHMVLWFFLPAVLTEVWQRLRRQKDNYQKVFATSALAVFFVAGVGNIVSGALQPAAIPQNVSEFFTDDYKTFVRVIDASCAKSATEQKAKSGLTDLQIAAYCGCFADTLGGALTMAELKAALGRKGVAAASCN
jgi:hypothetical protein